MSEIDRRAAEDDVIDGLLDGLVDDVDGVDGDGAGAGDTAGAGADEDGTSAEEQPRPTLMDQIGGPMGMVDSGLPVVVFVIANIIAGLRVGIIAALAAGVLIAVIRLVRRKPVTQAIGGLLAVGVAAYIAHRMGSARGYFLLGIWTYVVYGGALLASILVRWPLIGVLWEGLNGRGSAWRRDSRLRHRYDAATAVWVGVFALRFAVQQWLYGSDQVGWLAVARLAMGYPLFIVAIVLTVVIVGTATGMRLPSLWGRRAADQGRAADTGQQGSAS